MGGMANSIFSGREKEGVSGNWKVHSAAIAMIRHFLSRAYRDVCRDKSWRQMQTSIEQATNGFLGCVETKVFCFFYVVMNDSGWKLCAGVCVRKDTNDLDGTMLQC